MMDYENIEEQVVKICKATWENPAGKTVIFMVGGVAFLYFSGILLKSAAYATNGFKDLYAASMR